MVVGMSQSSSNETRPLRTTRVRTDLAAAIGVLTAFGVVQLVLIALH